jgi:predicted molibdopterin-dependent oxidoreductase YjgC
MFQRLPDAASAPVVPITIDGEPAHARVGDTVAAALLAAGRATCRSTPVSGAPRGPYCMMGVCFECLVSVDGVGNRQGCQVIVQPGMAVQTQRGKREVGA